MPKLKNDPVAKFVTGSKETKIKRPKSLTPKTKSTRSGDNKRDGKFAKSMPF